MLMAGAHMSCRFFGKPIDIVTEKFSAIPSFFLKKKRVTRLMKYSWFGRITNFPMTTESIDDGNATTKTSTG